MVAMNTITAARTVSISIHRSADEVYAFIADVENFPLWSAFAKTVKKEGSDWIFETPQGARRVRFAVKNKFRVLDHYVSVSPTQTVYAPMRVVANGAEACGVIFTVLRQPRMADEQFTADVALVVADLQSLKRELEREPATVEQTEEEHVSHG